MTRNLFYCCAAGFCLFFYRAVTLPAADWVSLFDGKTPDGWKAGNNAATFSIEDGAIVAHGSLAHLSYGGDVQQHALKNFEC